MKRKKNAPTPSERRDGKVGGILPMVYGVRVKRSHGLCYDFIWLEANR